VVFILKGTKFAICNDLVIDF